MSAYSDFQLVEPAPPFVVSGGDRKIKTVHLPPRYNADALVNERDDAEATTEKGGMREDLSAIRAQLRALGPIGTQLQALALKHASLARRTSKHTPEAEKEAVSEAAWWNCLLESLGLPSLASLSKTLAGQRL